jgi:glutamate racemase
VSWGVFDSGVGGLTVVHALRRRLPATRLTYLGDTARVPYGIRSVETVRDYARQAAEFLAAAGVEGIVVACNTASAVALDVFERTFGGPVIGVVEPGVRAALAASRTGRIGVIGTPATVRSDAYGRGLRERRADVTVLSRACPLFVPLAEEGWTEGDVPRLAAERYLAPLREEGVDALVLACTHYPLLKPVIGTVMGPEVVLVDSAEAVAGTVAEREAASGGPERERGPDLFYVTDAGGAFCAVAGRFLGENAPELETVRLGP